MSPSATQAQRTRATRICAAVFILIALALVITSLPVYREQSFICENSGARQGHCTWLIGITARPWHQASELERFMQSRHPAGFTNRWSRYATTGYNLLGSRVFTSHGQTGPILSISPDALDDHVRQLDDREKKALYDLLSAGDEKAIAERLERIREP